ncbi:MAG TPA: WecB/TagA/CpsF family glycosyltransferase [Candidatus Dormibacteraeota bacterium]|nr:WecB/TagA/CpsF family glycosyltransferase [Candidatus Dormibacteraeota bacterium]
MALGVLLTIIGLPPAAAGVYLLALALASFRAVPPAAKTDVQARLAVLVPAHDEEALIGRCLASLSDQTYPRSLYRVLVIADNCSDRTSQFATAAGAEVMERHDVRALGKGHALRWAMDGLLAADNPPDGIVVVDADSIADRDLLAALAAALAAGADAAQAEYLVLPADASVRSRLVAAAFLLFHRVRLGGRAALGLPASLVGNGMLFSRRLLEAMPWNAFTGVEDLEYTINLRMAGVRPRFVRSARLMGPVPHGYRSMRGQRLRWEGGRWHVVRRRLGPLLRHGLRRDPGALDAAIDLAVPPLGLLALAALAGSGVTAAAVELQLASAWSLTPWLLTDAAVSGFVVLGLWSARAPAAMWLALIESPRFLLWKVLTYARIAAGFDASRWERSERPATSTSKAPSSLPNGRVTIAGVPIDRVDMDAAVERLRDAVVHGRQVQVATVNMDFLVRAQRNPELMAVLGRTELNVADGMPLVWLSRLVGGPVPSRVAGADLVPRLMTELATRGAGVFLLGGEGGVAEAAAARLVRETPGLQVCGWHEPPRVGLDALDNSGLVEMIDGSGAAVLLVALGNPKQELWIARHRHRLPRISVAVGVGCVFDIWAGRVARAPEWMQRAGLEWLYRLVNEPRRLAGRFASDAAWLVLIAGRTLLRRAGPTRVAANSASGGNS